MALHSRTLPPQAAWSGWHPKLEGLSDKFRMITEPENWEGQTTATVSAFGFGGTNGFLVLKAAPPLPPAPPRGPYFLPVSAPDLGLLKEHLCELMEVPSDLDGVSSSLRLRQAQEYTLLARVKDRAEWKRMVQDVLTLSQDNDEIEFKGYLLGSTDRLNELDLSDWRKELMWLKPEAKVKVMQTSCSLPPSPLVRRSLWPLERLPGPQS